nr:uncharacterized protein LOC26531095 isoform X3 [Drosophila virilis]
MCIAKFSKGSFEAEIIDSREDREILDQQCQELNKDLLEAATKLNESEATTNDDKSEEPLAAYKSNTDTTNKSNLGQFEAFGSSFGKTIRNRWSNEEREEIYQRSYK